MLAGQGGELVHRHHQIGDDDLWRQAGEILGAVGGQDPLAAAHLGLQGGQGALGAGGIQIRQHPSRVRQVGEGAEGGTALVVDQDQGEVIRRSAQRQLHQPRDEQLGLPRTRCPGQQGVRAVRHQVGTYRPLCSHAEHRRQRRRAPGRRARLLLPPCPQLVGVEVVHDRLEGDHVGDAIDPGRRPGRFRDPGAAQVSNRLPPGRRVRRRPGRSGPCAQRLGRDLIVGAGHYLRAARVGLRAPGEAQPQPVVRRLPSLTLRTVPMARALMLRDSWRVIQHSNPDLVAGQKLGAPPAQRIAGALAHQGQALAVAERQDAASSASGTPRGQDLLSGGGGR